jgi:large subunit ribosomal protein L23
MKGKKPVQGKISQNVVSYPQLAEKSINMVEFENKLVFVVDRRATKQEIKEAVEQGFKVKVEDVNTVITTKGQKKAFVKLSPDHPASDVASRLGMV